MHGKTPSVRCGIATLLVLPLVVVLLASACSSAHRNPSTAPPEHSSGSTPRAVAGTSDDPTGLTLGDAESTRPTVDEDQALAELLEEILEDGPFPGEEVTRSPLDTLAEVSPEMDAARLEHERELLQAMVEPTFDIPMVTNDKVLFWLDYYANRRKDSFKIGLDRSGRYMDMFQAVFEEEGLPLDLIYMAHVESAYKTTAYSRARARGIFQFIAATGRRYGLRIDYWVDERLDPEHSARAATAYLKDLYAEFGDWYLALAAYNAGEGKIRSALRRSGKDDFWGIARTRYIRRETKNYVPAILAAIMISRHPEKYAIDVEPDTPLVYESLEIEGAADLQVLARGAGSDLDTMKRLNPSLRRYQTPPHATTVLHVPLGAGERTLAELQKVPVNERVLYARHRVRSGDTLYDLARDYGVSVSAIQQTNKMGGRTVIRVGDELIIPTVAAGSYPAPTPNQAEGGKVPGEPFVYRVRRGDNLSAIAGRYRTTASAIAGANGIDVREILRPGQRLTVVPGVRSSARATEIAQGDTKTPDGAITHTVRRGESLSVIARRYDTTPSGIASVNGMRMSRLLQIGDRLNVVPGLGYAARLTRAGAIASANRAEDDLVHTVRRGDSLWLIASRYNTTVDEICSRNSISKSTTLYPGTKLTISSN
jgi:membrane-bound lytic murein transglycosylase D